MAKTLFDIREEKELVEKLTAADPAGTWIHDFVHSKNPKFAGKSKKERMRMALGASYAAKRNEEVELEEAIKLGSKVMIHAPGKSYHGKTGHVGEIRNGAFKGAPKTYTVDHDGGSIQLDKKNIKLHKEDVDLDEAMDPKHIKVGDTVRHQGSKTKVTYDYNDGHVKIHAVDPNGVKNWKKVHKRDLVKEDSDIDEAAWGKDKMANLKAAHDRHSEKAIAANKAGDHDAVKVHQSKMNKIKTQMNKLRTEDVEQVDEISANLAGNYLDKVKAKHGIDYNALPKKRQRGVVNALDIKMNAAEKKIKEEADLKEAKHRVSVTVSEPDHPMVTKRKEQQQKFVRVSGDREGAVTRAQQHFKKQGYRVHGAEYVGTVNEHLELDEAGGMKSAALVKAMMRKQKQTAAMSPEKQAQQKQEYQNKKQQNEMSNVVFDNSGNSQGVSAGSMKPSGIIKPTNLIKPEKAAAARTRSLKHKEKKMNTEAKSLYDRHQEIRKKSGLPDPSHYLKKMKEKQAEIDAMKADQGSTERLHTVAPEPHPGAQKTFAGLRKKS